MTIEKRLSQMPGNERDTSDMRIQMEELRLQEEKLVQLKRRLLQLPAADSESKDGPEETASFLIVRYAKQRFAIPVECVDEVFEMVAVTEVTKRCPGVVGLVDYHGTLVVLLDLGELSGAGEGEIRPDNTIIICSVNQSRFGLMVEETSDVVTVEKRHIQTSDEIMPGIFREMGVLRFEQTTAAIIDLFSALLTVQLYAANPSLPVVVPDDNPSEESTT